MKVKTIEEVLHEIDYTARNYDHYEYGLPTHNESSMIDMKQEITNLIKYHIELALELAYEKVKYDYSDIDIIKESILNAYPPENIK